MRKETKGMRKETKGMKNRPRDGTNEFEL